MAAPPAAHAPGPDLPLGALGKRQPGFRDLDEAGHAVHRQLVARARLEDSAAHDPTCADGQRSKLKIPRCTYCQPRKRWCVYSARPARCATVISNIRVGCTRTSTCKCRWPCGITSTRAC